MNHLNLEQEIWFEINDESRGRYKDSNEVKFET